MIDFSTEPHPNKHWAIFVVSKIIPRPGRNHYQRVKALSTEYNLVVLCNSPLPEELEKIIHKSIVVKKSIQACSIVLKLSKELKRQNKKFYIHTQYSHVPAIAGFLCKKITGSIWVYDLWDHPSLGWLGVKGPSRWIRQLYWVSFGKWILKHADIWIIAMHPAILGYLPPANVNTKILFNRAGYINDNPITQSLVKNDYGSDRILKIVYVGPVMQQRGLNQMKQWAERYSGSMIEFHLIGSCSDNESIKILRDLELSCDRKDNLLLKVWGELSHSEVKNILEKSDIGLCPLDSTVLNYKYAYPIKVIEYMSFGLIVVASESHGTRTIIENGKNGIIASNKDGDFQEAIKKAVDVCQNYRKYELMRNNAQSTVKEYKWQNVNEKLIKRLKKALDL